MSAMVAAEAMAAGVRSAVPDAVCEVCPVSDGGEGFVEAMCAAAGGRRVTSRVAGPLGVPVDALWAHLRDGTAVIEMAAASGLELLPRDQRDPTRTTTYGTGELIRAALDAGAGRVLVGIGGSATCDGGAGMAQALGVRFIDDAGRALTEPLAGGELHRIAAVDLSGRDKRLKPGVVCVACDVTNPLTGPRGSARVYGPQKGATPMQVTQLDAALTHLAKVMDAEVDTPGFGAAGGMGFGLVTLLGARLERGVELVLDAIGFAARVRGADLCLTGEGRLDGQSLSGKTVLGVARLAAASGVRTFALVGSVGDGADACLSAGLSGYRVIGKGLAPAESMRRGAELMATAAANLLAELRDS